MTAFILWLTAVSLELANIDGEIKLETNNVELKVIFIPFVFINAFHNLNKLFTIYQFMNLFNTLHNRLLFHNRSYLKLFIILIWVNFRLKAQHTIVKKFSNEQPI